MVRIRILNLLVSYHVLCVNILANQPTGYLGCFTFDDNSFVNRTVIYWDNNTNSGSQCKKKCRSLPQRYAGTKVGACFCGDAFRKETNTTVCNQKCPGNANEICGDWSEIGVYDTWLCKTSPCKNGATCQDINASHYNCDCTPGWSGRLCDAESNRNPIAIYISVPLTIALVAVGVMTFFILRRRNQKKDDTSATHHQSKSTEHKLSAVINEAYIDHDKILQTPVHVNRTERNEANKNGVVIGEDNNSQYNIIDIDLVSEGRIEIPVSEDGYEHLNSKMTTLCDPTYSHTNVPHPKLAKDFTYSHVDKSAGEYGQGININATDSTYNTLNMNRDEKKRKQESKSTHTDTSYNKININRTDITDSRKSSDYDHTELRNISVLN